MEKAVDFIRKSQVSESFARSRIYYTKVTQLSFSLTNRQWGRLLVKKRMASVSAAEQTKM